MRPTFGPFRRVLHPIDVRRDRLDQLHLAAERFQPVGDQRRNLVQAGSMRAARFDLDQRLHGVEQLRLLAGSECRDRRDALRHGVRDTRCDECRCGELRDAGKQMATSGIRFDRALHGGSLHVGTMMDR